MTRETVCVRCYASCTIILYLTKALNLRVEPGALLIDWPAMYERVTELILSSSIKSVDHQFTVLSLAYDVLLTATKFRPASEF